MIVGDEKQAHAARDHELVRARERRLRANGGGRNASEVGHHLHRRRFRADARRLRLQGAAEAGVGAELVNRQRLVVAVH